MSKLIGLFIICVLFFAANSYTMQYNQSIFEEYTKDIHLVDNNGNNSVLYALMDLRLLIGTKTQMKIMEYCITNGANMYQKNNDGFTPFSLACYYFNFAFLKIFMKYNLHLTLTKKDIINAQKIAKVSQYKAGFAEKYTWLVRDYLKPIYKNLTSDNMIID